MGGVCPNEEEKRQIGHSGTVRAALNVGILADAVFRLPATRAERYRSRGFLVIGGMGNEIISVEL